MTLSFHKQFVAVAHLCRAAMAAPVVGDDAVATLEEEQHLGVPVIGRQRPAVTEDNRLARAPVLVEDLDTVGCGEYGHVPLLRRSGERGTNDTARDRRSRP